MGRTHAILAFLLVFIAACAPALADGKVFFKVGTIESGRMPDQRALLCWTGTTETLVIDTRFTGPPGEAAWLVPLPAVPEIESASPGLFPTLDALFATRVQRHVDTPLAPFLVIVTVVLLIGLLARTPRQFAVVSLLVLVPCLIPLALPSLGTARSSMPEPGVEVLDRRLVGVFETAVLTGDDPGAVLGWLREHGFAAPEGVEPVISEYLASGWVFAAARLNGSPESGEIEPRTPHPLAFRFETDSPVYPVRLTGVGNGRLAVDLYVFANGRASAPGWKPEMSLPTDRPGDPTFLAPIYRRLHEPIYVTHPELARFTGTLPTATHLSATLSEAGMRSDVTLEITPPSAYVPGVYTPEAAGQLGTQYMLLAMAASLAGVHAARFKRGWTTERSLKLAVALLVCSIAAVPITHLVLDVVPGDALTPRGAMWRSRDLHMDAVGDLWDEFRDLPRASFTLEDVHARAHELFGEHADEYGGEPAKLQDSPGNATIVELPDGRIAYTAHDRVGTPMLLGYVWEPANAVPVSP